MLLLPLFHDSTVIVLQQQDNLISNSAISYTASEIKRQGIQLKGSGE